MEYDTILRGDALAVLKTLPDECVQACVTSPPYFGLRQYDGVAPSIWPDTLGAIVTPPCADDTHEWHTTRYYREGGNARATSAAFTKPGAENMRRLKEARWRDDTFCSRCGAWRGCLGQERLVEQYVAHVAAILDDARRVLKSSGLLYLNLGDSYYYSRTASRDGAQRGWTIPGKSLIGVPWRVAIALQERGWILRNDVIWHRVNALAEPSAKDRAHRRHEHIFIFAKSRRVHFDRSQLDGEEDVWTIPIAREDVLGHSAPFPRALASRCIRTGSRAGDTVLDPFIGSGTTAIEALTYRRHYIGIEASATLAAQAERRIMRDAPPSLWGMLA